MAGLGRRKISCVTFKRSLSVLKMRSFDIVRNNNNPLKKCLKLRKKSTKKVQWFLMLQEKKKRKIGHQKASFTLLDNFSSKIIFFSIIKAIKYIALTNTNYVKSKQYSNENIGKWKRYWVYYTNSNFLIPITLKPNWIDLKYFKLWIWFDEIIKVRNVNGFHHQVAKIVIG